MATGRNKLYLIMALACIAGYVWLFLNLRSGASHDASVCLIKNVTDIPCPSCGSTRSVIALLHGDFVDAFYFNPFGILILIIMVVMPLWLVRDIVSGQSSLFSVYKKIETVVNRPRVAIPLLMLVAANWVWNIMKGL